MKTVISMGFALAAFCAALLQPLAAAASGDLPPENPGPQLRQPSPKADGIEPPIRCTATMCVMPRQFADLMLEAHNLHVDEIRDLQKQLETIKGAKGCAKIEVVPNFKKERDL